MSDMTTWFTYGTGIDGLERRAVHVPEPTSHEVLLQLSARSLNYRDLLVVDGVGHWRPAHPVVPVSDGVGTVVALGNRVTRFGVGDRVSPMFLPHWQSGPPSAAVTTDPVGGPVNRGMLADFVVVPEEQAAHVPRTLSDVEAATLPIAALTAWHAVVRTGVRPGDTVLVHGTGGVAIFAQQFAVALGARVAITSASTSKLDRARQLGAELTLDRRVDDVAGRAREWTGGLGVDHVVETVGGANLNLSLRALRVGGHVAFVGLIDGVTAEVNTYDFVTRSVDLQGIETGSRELYEQMAAFIDRVGLRPVVDQVASMDDVRAQLHRLRDGCSARSCSRECSSGQWVGWGSVVGLAGGAGPADGAVG